MISMSMRTARAAVPFCFLMLATILGCGGPSSRWMARSTTPLASRESGSARVVFVGRCGGSRMTVVDETSRFLGQCAGDTWWAVDVAPGEHDFVIWSENVELVHASLAPDRTYYVIIQQRMGAWRARVEAEAFTSRHAEWSHLSEWTREDARREADLSGGDAEIHREAGAADRKVAEGRAQWAEWTEEDRARRTLHAEDGAS